jgi:hypothetical protein
MAGTSPAMTEKALRPVSDFQKLFLTPDPNHFYIHRHPVPLRGALRNVTSAGRDAVDADGAPDEGA